MTDAPTPEEDPYLFDPKFFAAEVLFGLWLGYPACCCRYFIERGQQLHAAMREAAATGVTPESLLPASFVEDTPLQGTGYVPCLECRKKGEDELKATIAINRFCPTTFPDYELSGGVVMVGYDAQGNYIVEELEEADT